MKSDDQERTMEYDKVWREAEEWLEAQAEAEEVAWQQLLKDVPPPPGLEKRNTSNNNRLRYGNSPYSLLQQQRETRQQTKA